jgi:Fic family protein
VSPYLERHRAAYTDLLLRVSQKGDFLAWVRFFLEAVAESARATIERAEALLTLRREYHGRLSTARSSSLLLKLVDALFERPSLSIGAASRLLDVTPAAASANLQKLVQAKILIEVTGRKRDQRYVAREILVAAHAE